MEFWEIYDRYYSSVQRYAASMLRDSAAGDDVVQETFLRAHANLAELRDPGRVLAWLFRIAHNLCIDQLRARQSDRIDLTAAPDVQNACDPDSAERDVERDEMSACVREQIDRLPESHRSVILLFDIMGLSQQQIADILGIEVGAVKVRLHRARKALRAVLEDRCSFARDDRNVLVCEPKLHR